MLNLDIERKLEDDRLFSWTTPVVKKDSRTYNSD